MNDLLKQFGFTYLHPFVEVLEKHDFVGVFLSRGNGTIWFHRIRRIDLD